MSKANNIAKGTATYPTEGLWYWLNTEEEAYAFFNLPMPELAEI